MGYDPGCMYFLFFIRLEPLLQRIKEDRTVVSIPIIDVIDDKTLEYSFGMNGFFQVGGFDWNGHFNWINIPKREKKRKKRHIDPTRYFAPHSCILGRPYPLNLAVLTNHSLQGLYGAMS